MIQLCQSGEVRATRGAGRFVVGASWMSAFLMSCTGLVQSIGPDPGAIENVPSKVDPGTPVAVPAPLALEDLSSELQTVRALSAPEVFAAHTPDFETDLGYDPLTARGLPGLLELFDDSQAATDAVAKNGFVMEATGRYPSFADGYAELYMRDLPVFISSDMVLEAVYRSHDKILQTLEKEALKPRLDHFLGALRQRVIHSSDTLSPETASDINLYLGVAISLLHGGVDPREHDGVGTLYEQAVKAAGVSELLLFGVKRWIDFSQFQPRGHYTGDVDLERYFRAMIWLGRTEFRLVETVQSGEQVLRRRQVESMVALRRLLDAETYAEYTAFDDVITAFVGEHDYMPLQDVERLLADLGNPSNLDDVSDEVLAATIIAGQFGEQRIASQVMTRWNAQPATLPLSLSFALLGQRYTVDSHVFSNLVYDRLPTRVIPNPLDAAFAAFGNDQALGLLADELETEENFAGELAAIRTLVDAHPETYWGSSFYTSWLGALRTLSPAAVDRGKLPTVARTEAWGLRLLNTQLASWSQLRHNNVLYVKQSYTSGQLCVYPDAYVDPYPDFFEAVASFAEQGLRVMEGVHVEGDFSSRADAYFTNLANISTRLARMARAQQTGEPHAEDDLAFINEAVTVSRGCAGPATHTGWYSKMHFDPDEAASVDPTITDVHTDVGGDFPVARDPSVLHVGTALPRLMVVTVDSCEGPRAYAGAVFDYREIKADGFTRYTDEEWKQAIYDVDLPRVPWLAPVAVD
jgi:hypothetical protein